MQLLTSSDFDSELFFAGKMHDDRINSINYSPDGKTFVTSSQDRKIKLWDQDYNLLKILVGHTDEVLEADFHPVHNNFIVSCSEDKTAKKWLLNTHFSQSFNEHEQSVRSVAFHPNKPLYLSGDGSGNVYVWDQNGITVNSVNTRIQINSMDISPDGNDILIGGSGSVVKWDGQSVTVNVVKRGVTTRDVKILNNDGDILSCGNDNLARLWNYKNPTQAEIVFEGHQKDIYSVDYSEERKMVITGGADGLAFIWDLEGNIIDTIDAHRDMVVTVAFSPKGDYFLTGSWDNTFKLWMVPDSLDINGNKAIELQTFENHTSDVDAVSFYPISEDKLLIISASSDNTACLWEFDTKTKSIKELPTVIRHRRSIREAKFSPDGKYVLTGSSDKSSKLWNIEAAFLDELFKDVAPLEEEINSITLRLEKEIGFIKNDK